MPNAPATRFLNRKLKQGEILLKPGDRVKNVYLIQSGRISLCQNKGDKIVEIAQLTAPDSIGDEAVFGPLQWNTLALALRETVVIELPVEVIQKQFDLASADSKAIFKALSDRIRASFGEIRTLQSNREMAPCPPDGTAKVFGVIFHSARAVGQVEGAGCVVSWPELQSYAYEVFQESMIRLEDALNILVKLGYASFQSKDPRSAPHTVRLSDLGRVESFFEYYGNYHFKGGSRDLLKTNTKVTLMTEQFLKIADQYPVDRGGNAHLPFKATIDALKAALGKGFEADQLFRLEQKGLFMKRRAAADGGTLSFYKPDFQQMLLNWRILREIEGWNEKGYVDMAGFASAVAGGIGPQGDREKWSRLLADWKPPVERGVVPQIRTGAKSPRETWCSVCMSVVSQGQAICEVCGVDLKAA